MKRMLDYLYRLDSYRITRDGRKTVPTTARAYLSGGAPANSAAIALKCRPRIELFREKS
jgi:hypothetical protein